MARTRASQRSARATTTARAASVPVSQPENSKLESLRLKKHRSSILDDEDTPPSSLPSAVITRGRKRNASFGATDCMPSTSAPVVAPLPEPGEQRPRKRRKRASSTPAMPRRPSQSSAPLQSHRRSRSRAGSPVTDVEYVAPSRASARLARRIHSFISGRNSDIYTHLAGPDGTGDLLSQPPAGVVLSFPPNETVGSQPDQKPRGRRRKMVDLTDESVKKDLMEEWARMRQSQGTLSLSGIDDNTRCSQMQLCDTRKDDGVLELERARRCSPNAHVQGATLRESLPPQMDSENALPSVDKDGGKADHIDSNLCSKDRTEPFTPDVDGETFPPLIPGLRVGEGVPCTGDLDPSQHLASPQISVPRLGENAVGTVLPVSETVSLESPPKESHSETFSPAPIIGKSSIYLDPGQEFHMLDIPEIFTLPWEPVAPRLYVPPTLGKLISGMREQLAIEARARRRAEELYQTELSRRRSVEKTIKDLRAELDKQTRQDGSR